MSMKIKIEAVKFEPEITIEQTIGEIKAGHMKNINSIDMKLSGIASIKPISPSEEYNANFMMWPFLKLPENHHMHHNPQNIFPP